MSAEGHRLKRSISELVQSTAHKIATADLMIFADMSLSFLVLCRHFESELKYYFTTRDGNVTPSSIATVKSIFEYLRPMFVEFFAKITVSDLKNTKPVN